MIQLMKNDRNGRMAKMMEMAKMMTMAEMMAIWQKLNRRILEGAVINRKCKLFLKLYKFIKMIKSEYKVHQYKLNIG